MMAPSDRRAHPVHGEDPCVRGRQVRVLEGFLRHGDHRLFPFAASSAAGGVEEADDGEFGNGPAGARSLGL